MFGDLEDWEFLPSFTRKWLWRFGHEANHFWREVIATKSGEDRWVGVLELIKGLMVALEWVRRVSSLMWRE